MKLPDQKTKQIDKIRFESPELVITNVKDEVGQASDEDVAIYAQWNCNGSGTCNTDS